MLIQQYAKQFEDEVMRLMESEGEKWTCYTEPGVAADYKKLLSESITYVALRQDGSVCGFVRALPDGIFNIYICDLQVYKSDRGQGIGRQLMERLCTTYPKHDVFVFSDNDGYYENYHYHKEGSIFKITVRSC